MSNLPGTPRVQIYPASDEATGYPSAPSTSGGLLNVANYWWDTNTLQWTKATGGSLPGANVNVQNFPASFGASQVGPWSVAVNNLPATQPVSEADGANVTIGATSDAAITTNVAGTVSGKLRGIVAILASVWNSALGSLYVSFASNGDTIDAINSSVTPLGSNGVFTGSQWVNTLNFAQIVISTFSDRAGTIQIQFSTNGVDIDHVHDYAILAGIGENIQAHTHSKFYRIVYTNGAIAQTTFRLQSILRPVAGSGSIVEADDVIGPYDDCALTKSILTGQSVTDGAYVNAKMTPDGGLVINQDIQIDAGNSSTANLAVGATFTGAVQSNIIYTAIQVVLKTDQNCVVYVDQGPTALTVDTVTDSYEYFHAIGNFGITVNAVGAFYRVRVTNVGVATTTSFILQSIGVPILSALPRSLSPDGWLQTAVNHLEDDNGFHKYLTPFGEDVAVPVFRLIGSVFNGNTLDTNFWTAVTGTGGTVTPTNGLMAVSTGTTANNAVSLTSVYAGRFISGSSHQFRAIVRLDTAVVNNVRTWGCATATDGVFFELNGTTLNLCVMNAGTVSRIANGSFNGPLGNVIKLDTSAHFYQIFYTPAAVWFMYDNELLHTQQFPLGNWTSNMDLPIQMTNTNSGGLTTNISMYTSVATLVRMGLPVSQPVPTAIHGAGTVTLKVGSGNLQRVLITSNTGSAITLYDNTAGSGKILAAINPNQLCTLDFAGCAFSIGLTVVTVGSTIDCTIVYE